MMGPPTGVELVSVASGLEVVFAEARVLGREGRKEPMVLGLVVGGRWMSVTHGRGPDHFVGTGVAVKADDANSEPAGPGICHGSRN
jgi:hypothetical protein